MTHTSPKPKVVSSGLKSSPFESFSELSLNFLYRWKTAVFFNSVGVLDDGDVRSFGGEIAFRSKGRDTKRTGHAAPFPDELVSWLHPPLRRPERSDCYSFLALPF